MRLGPSCVLVLIAIGLANGAASRADDGAVIEVEWSHAAEIDSPLPSGAGIESLAAVWNRDGLSLRFDRAALPTSFRLERSDSAAVAWSAARVDRDSYRGRYSADDPAADALFGQLAETAAPLAARSLEGDAIVSIPWRDLAWLGGRPDPETIWRLTMTQDDSVARESQLRFLAPAPSRNASIVARGIRTRVVGSPDPPLPYRIVPTATHLQPHWPIQAIAEPGSRRLWIIEEEGAYGTTRIVTAPADAASGPNADAHEPLRSLELQIGQPDGESEVAYSLAFHPRFDENGLLLVGSNGGPPNAPKRSRVASYRVRRDGDRVAVDPTSRRVLIEWDSDGHNGAAIAFGTDGMLYVTSGDGTSDSDRNVVGQGTDHLLAKVLRIDIDSRLGNVSNEPGPDSTYLIPPDNPFVDDPRFRAETFAYGLRNPWRIAVDPELGHVWVGNNGQDLWEQVYRVDAGANYGWSVVEGSHPFHAQRIAGPTPISKPTFEHHHAEARSLTGGVVYRGKRLPELHGAYVYGDYATGRIWGAKVDADGTVLWHRLLADGPEKITCLELDCDGELLIADHGPRGLGGFRTLEPMPTSDSDRESFPERLSETGLFESVAAHRPIAGAIPYDVNSPLWSDGAIKARFVVLPPTADAASESPARIVAQGAASWTFPEGTVLVKSFGFTGDSDETVRWHETRIMVLQQGEWAGYTYRWNETQDDAQLVAGEGEELPPTAGADRERYGLHQGWRYPSRTECLVCHSRAANFVLGLSFPQLDGPFDPTFGGWYRATANEPSIEGTYVNRLDFFADLGLLATSRPSRIEEERERWRAAGLSDDSIAASEALWSRSGAERDRGWEPRLPTAEGRSDDEASEGDRAAAVDYAALVAPDDDDAPLDRRVRSYLQANCAHCHVEAGGGNARIDLAAVTARERMMLDDQMPVHAADSLIESLDVGAPIDPATLRLIAPGAPERSVLWLRAARRGPGQMPPIASNVADPLGVELLRRWILEEAPPPLPR